MEYLHKLVIDFENKPSGVPDYFACNVVELIANGLYRMPLPIVLQGFFEEHKKVVCQYPYLKIEGVVHKNIVGIGRMGYLNGSVHGHSLVWLGVL
jgi:hypothetical protein